MKNTTAIVIAVIIIIGVGYFVTRDTNDNVNNKDKIVSNNYGNIIEAKKEVTDGEENSVIKDGVQYVTIVARGGYSPHQSIAKAGIPTKLVMRTNGTYDCSASLVIRSLGYRNILPNTGETIIDAGTPKAGNTLQGVCGMGMYSFVVQFK